MKLLQTLASDYDRFRFGLPKPLEEYVLDTYRISLASEYGGHSIKNPFGKASGQLSLNTKQIERDVEAGLGFVVLKTLIAQDAAGSQSMKAWAIPATHMTVEHITGTRPEVQGEEGWTVTWKGRGWSDTMEAYLNLFNDSLTLAANTTLIIPSVKFHLPTPEESSWKVDEYNFTTQELLKIWEHHNNTAMPIEKDFSPTLAGDMSFSSNRLKILEWLKMVPKLIRAAAGDKAISIGLKLFNATYSDEFQLEMLRTCCDAIRDERADYLIYGNRLFDPNREYEGKRGVAFGGPDLSARNLNILNSYSHFTGRLPFSATGNIVSGRIAFEYLKRGATSFQMHTVFQLPDAEFDMQQGSRIERALHKLLFHPINGLLACILSSNDIHLCEGITIAELAKQYSERTSG